MLIFFTTAPEVYDLPGTVTAGHVGFTGDGHQLRAVRVDMGGALPQVRRYMGAGYLIFDAKEILEADVYLEARAAALIAEAESVDGPIVNLGEGVL